MPTPSDSRFVVESATVTPGEQFVMGHMEDDDTPCLPGFVGR